jgi:hypothetical protein
MLRWSEKGKYSLDSINRWGSKDDLTFSRHGYRVQSLIHLRLADLVMEYDLPHIRIKAFSCSTSPWGFAAFSCLV